MVLILVSVQRSTSEHSPTAGSVKSSSLQKRLPFTYYNYPVIKDLPNSENNEKANLLNWVKKDSMVV